MKKFMEARELNNILVVDDTPVNLHLLTDILKKYNYQVRPVPNGKLALSAAEINPPDLILLDINMPDLDGYQVCKQLKSNYKTKDIPVIFISAISEPVDKVKAFLVGGVDYITKPFQIHEVLIRVKNQLDIYTLQQKLKAKNEKLNNTIHQLKLTQKKLIKSEKNLALDKLITGISSRVQNPLSEIQASLSEIDSFNNSSLENLPDFLQHISPEQQKYFAALLKQARQSDRWLSVEEHQQLRTKIISKLEIFQLQHPETVADAFIALGCDLNLEAFLPLLTETNYLALLENARLIHILHKSIKDISQSAAQFNKIMLAFESCSSHQQNEPKRQANIKNTIELALQTTLEGVSSKIKVVKHYATIAPAYCHPEDLQRIWTNLIDNALEAMGKEGTLTIEMNQQQENAIVTISDTGVGIPQELIPKICDPFFTTKSTAAKVGIGLTIAKQLVEKHDGNISVKSSPGKTRFTVSFPIKEGES